MQCKNSLHWKQSRYLAVGIYAGKKLQNTLQLQNTKLLNIDCAALCFIAYSKSNMWFLFWKHSLTFAKKMIFFLHCKNIVAFHKMQSNRLIYRIRSFIRLWAIFHFNDEWMCEWHSYKFAPTKRSRCSHMYHLKTVLPQFSLKCALYNPLMYSIETKCKPYFDTLNRILSFSWHNKFHSTLGKSEMHLKKPKHCVRQKKNTQHTHTEAQTNALKLNSKQFDSGDLVFGWKRMFL